MHHCTHFFNFQSSHVTPVIRDNRTIEPILWALFFDLMYFWPTFCCIESVIFVAAAGICERDMMQKSGSSQKYSRSQKQETFSANVEVVSRSRCPAESCRISYQWDKSQICPTMSSPHISTLPLILTSLATYLPLVTLATHNLTCLPSSSSIEVPSDGELEVQCNVTVPNTQVCFWVPFSLWKFKQRRLGTWARVPAWNMWT